MYMKSKAILRPGKIIPIIGTKIDGKYDAVIILMILFILIYYCLILINFALCYR